MEQLKHWLVTFGIDYFLYITLLVITLVTVKTMIENSVKSKLNDFQQRYRLRKIRTTKTVKEKQYTNPFIRHIYFLLKTTSKEKKEQDILAFFIVTSCAFIFTLIFSFLSFGDLFFAFFLAILVGLIPYMILQIRLRNLRYSVGSDFLSIIQMLAQNYNSAQYDMYHALVETSKEVKNKALRQVLIRLISDLQVSRNEQEIRLSIELFIFTAGSSWAKRLGNIILKSYLYDEKVLNTLLTLIRQIEETEEMLEEEKSHALDSVWNGYLTVPIFIASLILGYYVSGAQDWFHLQFGNVWTRMLFVVCIVLVVFSVITSMILKKPKNDI
ncbi:hypothetical protein [Alkalihalobacillus sp. BA299]|uniref:hypothetical protein n=1 Tax=Alkalihalobacillus sp. BA299 TaxID=2815938 RepID=UPI001ADA525B|nr:hypothetical protein [Alkalihalobacillus sp. BA299]